MQLTTIEQHEEILGKEALELIRIRLQIFESIVRSSEAEEKKHFTSF